MPVQQLCPCGQQLTVAAELVGRQVRCPSCNAVVLVEPPVATMAAPPPVEPDAIRFQCAGCGKTMKARVQHAGSQIVCPGCNATLTVPGGMVTARPVARPVDEEEPSGSGAGFWVGMVLVLLMLGGGGFAAWWFLIRDATPADLRLVPADATAFVSVRVADVWKSDEMKKMVGMSAVLFGNSLKEQEAKFGLELGDLERVTTVVGEVGDLKDDPAVWVIFLTSKDYDKDKIRHEIMPGAAEQTSGKFKYYAAGRDTKGPVLYFHSDRIFVFASQKGIKACFDQIENRKKDGALKAAIKEASGKHQVVAAGVLPAELTAKMHKDMPPEVEPYKALLDVKAAMLVADLLGQSSRAEFTLTYADSGQAGKAKDAAESLRKMALDRFAEFRQMANGPAAPKEAQLMLDKLDAALKESRIEQNRETLVISVKIDDPTPVLTGLMVPSVQKVREAAARTESMNNLHQIGIALQNYHDTNGALPPPASYSAQGQPLLSWRVHLLPFIEQQNLYNQFHLDEPWDSPHNITLLSSMPRTYRTPDQPVGATMTHYQVFSGDQRAPFIQTFAPNQGPHHALTRTLPQITDGTSNTIAVVEATREVPWTKPEDVPFAPTPQGYFPNGLGLRGSTSFSAALFDGSVKRFPKSILPMNLQAWITPNAGDLNSEP